MRRLIQLSAIQVVVWALLATSALARPAPAPIGVVTGAQRALVGQAIAIEGTNLYDGDTVATEPVGVMRLRLGESQMVLAGNTAITLHKNEASVSIILLRGVVRFVSVPGSALELHALKAVVVRAKGDTPAGGQLAVVAPNAFQIGSTKGVLAVSVNGNNRDVAEATAYRVILDDVDSGSGGAPGTLPAAHSAGFWIMIAAVGAAAAVVVTLAFLSPHKL